MEDADDVPHGCAITPDWKLWETLAREAMTRLNITLDMLVTEGIPKPEAPFVEAPLPGEKISLGSIFSLSQVRKRFEKEIYIHALLSEAERDYFHSQRNHRDCDIRWWMVRNGKDTDANAKKKGVRITSFVTDELAEAITTARMDMNTKYRDMLRAELGLPRL